MQFLEAGLGALDPTQQFTSLWGRRKLWKSHGSTGLGSRFSDLTHIEMSFLEVGFSAFTTFLALHLHVEVGRL
jgi:hypothetical protein